MAPKRTTAAILMMATIIMVIQACAHRNRFTPKEDDTLFIRRIIRLEGTDLIDNLNTWNVRTNVKNLYPGDTILYLSEVRCAKGDVEGKLDIEHFPKNNMHFDRGQVRKIAFRCLFPAPYESSGDYKVTIGRIFSNPLGDGETTDRVIATDVTWKIKPSKDI